MHPDGRRLDPRKRRRMVRDQACRSIRQLAVEGVVIQVEAGDDADRVADRKTLDPFTDGGNRPRRLVSVSSREAWGQRYIGRLRNIDLGAVEPQRFDADLHFALSRGRNFDILDLVGLRAHRSREIVRLSPSHCPPVCRSTLIDFQAFYRARQIAKGGSGPAQAFTCSARKLPRTVSLALSAHPSISQFATREPKARHGRGVGGFRVWSRATGSRIVSVGYWARNAASCIRSSMSLSRVTR